MGPIDYKVDVANPFQGAVQGYALGSQIQQQQVAQAQQQQQQKIIQSLVSNPSANANDYANAMALVPQMATQLKSSWDTKNTAQQQAHLSNLTQLGSAIQSGHPEVASASLRSQADAMDTSSGSPTPQSQSLRANADAIDAHPELARFMINAQLAAHPDGGKVISALAQMGQEQRAQAQAPADLKLKQAQADEAATKAGVSAATVPDQVAKPGLENQKTAEDIQTAQSQRDIAALNVQIAQANSETQRGQLTLERDKLIQKQQQTQQTAGQDAQSQMDGLNQGLVTVDALMKHPGLNSGTGFGSNMASWFNGSDAKDFRLQLETLKSQQFLTAAKELKGMGALSDAEGARLEKAVASLSPEQSTAQFKNNLGVIQSTLKKAQNKVLANPKLPTAGGGFVVSVPQFGKVTEGDINRMMQQHPGATRAQAMQYLQSLGAK